MSSNERNASAEYTVVKKNLDKIASHISVTSLPRLANLLFSVDLIGNLEHSNAMNSSQPFYNRATDLIISVLRKIENDCSCYKLFVEALIDSDLRAIAEVLESSLNREQVTMTSPHVISGTGCSENLEPISSSLKKMILKGEGLHMLYDLNQVDEFIQSARQVRLIPQHVVDDLKMMHPSVLHESRCRYLMLHICKAVSPDGNSFYENGMDKFISLICKYFNVDQIKQISCQSSQRVPEGLRKSQVFRYKLRSDMILESMHLDRLYNVLSGYSHLWNNIGRALHFTDNELKEIYNLTGCDDGKRLYLASCDDCKRLYAVLQNWLFRRDCGDEKLPSIKNLNIALCSNSIGLESVAKECNKTLSTKMMNFDKEDSDACMCISSDIKLVEHDSPTTFLLEVEVNLRNVSLQHNWYKDGEYFNCSPSVFKNNCILCIEAQDIQVEGEYTYMCSVGDELLGSESVVVNVRTFLCKHRQHLTSRYNSQPELPVEEYAWPDVSQNTYINVAVVGGRGTMSRQHYQQTIRGNADDVLNECKANVEYKKAFQDIKHGDRVLVVGRPGSGKTTLVYRVSKDWANRFMLGHLKALFLIYLRGFHSNPSIDLRHLVSCYFNKEEDIYSVCKYIEEREGLGMCFILDGLDEYQPKEDQDTTNFIFQLIKGSVLPHAVVIVASRPAAVYKFTKIARRQVEVLGFFKEQVEEYINSYKFSSESMQSALMKYLNHHPNIQHMCYLPIQTAMICFLFDVCGDTLPNTETGIYEEFTKHTVLRAIYRNGDSQHTTLLSLKCLKGKEKMAFVEICKVAFEMTKSSKQVIQQEEIKTDGNQINDSLGLITVDWKATLCGFQNMYSFCHLTFQEFLAAYHISTLDIQDQLASIQHCGPMQHMYVVFKFYCGLVKFEKDCIQFKRLLEVSKFKTLHQVHCCFESQQPATCNLVVDRNMIVVDNSFSTPSDFTSLGYVVVNATQNKVRILDIRTIVDDECGEAFVNATVKSNKGAVPVELLACTGGDLLDKFVQACSSVSVLRWIHSGMCSNDIILTVNVDLGGSKEVIDNIFEKFPKTKRLCIMGDSIIGESSFSHFLSVYCNPISTFCNDNFQRAEALTIAYHMVATLYCERDMGFFDTISHDECLCTNLCIFNCNINNETAAVLAGGLKYNTSLEVMKLVANSIGDEGAVAIAGSIKGCSSLHYLDLSLNRISDRGAVALLSCIEGRSNFNLLLFDNNISDIIASKEYCVSQWKLWHTMDITECIGDEGLAHVVSIMKEWTPPLSIARTLHTVYLQSCNNRSDCNGEIFKVLARFTSLRSVSLIDMNIHDGTMKSLAGSIQNQSITVLNLSHNSIGDEGAADIAEAIKQCKMLSELDLSGNCVEDAGTELLSSALKSCKLQRLNLSSNNIGDTGALAIAGVLVCSLKSLQDLSLSFNRFSEVGAICLARGLKGCSNLTELHLSGNSIGDKGAEALAETLQTSHQLSSLSLSSNTIGNTGAEALAKSLQTCHQLSSLSLSSNTIGNTGAEALAKSLQTCHQLSSLSLSSNTIGDTGAEALAKSIQTCHQLSSLCLSDNEIGDTGAHHLGKYLKHCSSLQNLKLNDNLVSGVGAAEVAESVKHCTFLHT